MKKFLFLYTELADYFLVCAETLALSPADVMVVHWPVNKEAPFRLSSREGVKLIQKDSMSLDELNSLIKSFAPDAVYCGGWLDKDYLRIVRSFKGKIPCIIGLDNHWSGSIKQRIACFGFKRRLKKYFSHCWVPGKPQYPYAEHLGFQSNYILRGFYSADVRMFHKLGEDCLSQKAASFPRRFIFVGRYYDFKGVRELWEAFNSLPENSDWELWCLGKGDIKGETLSGLHHFGFVQPEEMGSFIAETGVFILPSWFEPWGVVVHEFAAAGFPLLLSDEVGAASQFLEDNKNGFLFESENTDSLRESMLKIIGLSDTELLKMGALSRKFSESITPDTWTRTLTKIVSDVRD